ncbi:inner membrane protein YbiR, partial [Escherichia coli 97.1742]
LLCLTLFLKRWQPVRVFRLGGFGLLPGSLANLIALRMANDRRIWWRFHLYSIPMLLWAALVGYVLLVMIPAW